MNWFPLHQLIANISPATKVRLGFSSLTPKVIEQLRLTAQGLDHKAYLLAMLDLNNMVQGNTSPFVALIFLICEMGTIICGLCSIQETHAFNVIFNLQRVHTSSSGILSDI